MFPTYYMPITPTLDQYLGQVVMNLRMQGANHSTTFTDSTGRHAITAVGTAEIVTSQAYIGGSSAYFDGSGACIYTPKDVVDFNFADGDFTMEAFVMVPSSAPVKSAVTLAWDGGSSANPGFDFTLGITAGGVISSVIYNYKHTVDYGGTGVTCSLAADTWHHIGVQRKTAGGNTYQSICIDGTTYTHHNVAGITQVVPGSDLYIGHNPESSGRDFTGYIGGFRITKGAGRYNNVSPYNYTVPLDFPTH